MNQGTIGVESTLTLILENKSCLWELGESALREIVEIVAPFSYISKKLAWPSTSQKLHALEMLVLMFVIKN